MKKIIGAYLFSLQALAACGPSVSDVFAVCGDGVIQGAEACDGGEGCNADCTSLNQPSPVDELVTWKVRVPGNTSFTPTYPTNASSCGYTHLTDNDWIGVAPGGCGSAAAGDYVFRAEIYLEDLQQAPTEVGIGFDNRLVSVRVNTTDLGLQQLDDDGYAPGSVIMVIEPAMLSLGNNIIDITVRELQSPNPENYTGIWAPALQNVVVPGSVS